MKQRIKHYPKRSKKINFESDKKEIKNSFLHSIRINNEETFFDLLNRYEKDVLNASTNNYCFKGNYVDNVSALMIVIEYGNSNMFNELIKRGSNIFSETSSGDTALSWAITCGRHNMLCTLNKELKKAIPSLLKEGVEYEKIREILKYIKESKIKEIEGMEFDVNFIYNRKSLLEHAVSMNNIYSSMYLVESGAVINENVKLDLLKLTVSEGVPSYFNTILKLIELNGEEKKELIHFTTSKLNKAITERSLSIPAYYRMFKELNNF